MYQIGKYQYSFISIRGDLVRRSCRSFPQGNPGCRSDLVLVLPPHQQQLPPWPNLDTIPLPSSTLALAMAELRQRQSAAVSRSGDRSNARTTQPEPERRTEHDDDHGISVLDIIRVIASLTILSCGLSYYMTNSESYLWGYRPWFTRWPLVKSYLVSYHHPKQRHLCHTQ